MVHPSELLRSDSNGERGFSAPVGNYRSDIDCGLSELPCLNRLINLEKCAKPGYFVLVLSILGVLYGILKSYFKATSHLWGIHYNISQDLIDWFIYINEGLMGVFGLVVAYWGNRIHRATWIGSLAIYLAISSATLSVPEFYNPFKDNETNIEQVTGPVLCRLSSAQLTSIIRNEFQVFSFIILGVYQLLFALAYISFISHGLTYIDDNMSPKNSPGYIGLTIAGYEIGKQIGIYLSWTPYIFQTDSIFLSPVWIVVAVFVFFGGVIILMFPKVMPNILIKKSVTSLLSLASGNTITTKHEQVDGFFKSLWRIVTNRILLINILSIVLMKSALVNFNILEKYFNQAKYHVEKYNDVSGYTDATMIQFTTNLLKQPLVAISVITSGFVIAKMRPTARSLVIWNLIVYLIVTALFASTHFLSCASKFKNELRDQLIIPYCSWNCGCSLDGPFQPICLNRETYFSPCIAGCSNYDEDSRIYQNCSCALGSSDIAVHGSCDAENCSTLLAVSQVNNVISYGLIATTFVSAFIINMRCVSNKDKALALGLELTFIGLVPYVPVRAVFSKIADNFCQIRGKLTCQFYSEQFSLFLASATVILMVSSAVFALILLFLISDLKLYGNDQTQPSSYVEETNTNSGIELPARNTEEDDALLSNNEPVSLRRRELSEGRLNNPSHHRSSKEDRINSYLSEGDLVPPLKSNLKKIGKSNSKNSNTSGFSTDSSLNAIANTVGDDHDSDAFSRPSTLSRNNNQLETSF